MYNLVADILIAFLEFAIKYSVRKCYRMIILCIDGSMMTSSDGNIFRHTICSGNTTVTGEFPAQRPVTRSFEVFFEQRLNKRLNKQSWFSLDVIGEHLENGKF